MGIAPATHSAFGLQVTPPYSTYISQSIITLPYNIINCGFIRQWQASVRTPGLTIRRFKLFFVVLYINCKFKMFFYVSKIFFAK